MIQIKRAYEATSATDGQRILVDRLWPRGVSKERAKIDRWAKELAPSTALRKWFGHDPAKWAEFQKRYMKELLANGEALREIAGIAQGCTVTLVFAARDEQHNEAVVLKEIIETLEGK
ncbi:MAG TPA: DUF488 domain-containing protein [Fimbriimonadaceae bacterium]|nr:DUF488 domain-containing protein [Fimbriimonadaceae bacterium]